MAGVKKPKLDAYAANIRQRYTLIKPCCVQDTPDAQTVWFKVGSQSFCVTSLACETEEEAKWFQDRLANALSAMVKELLLDAK